MVEEAQSGIVTTFSLATSGDIEHRLPEHLVAMMLQFDLDLVIRETLLIGDYSSTNLVPSQLTSNEVVIHGAKMRSSWDIVTPGVSVTKQ